MKSKTKRSVTSAEILGIDASEDLLDQLDTMAEQIDPEFQKSLGQSMEEYIRGDVGTMEGIRRILRRKEKGRV